MDGQTFDFSNSQLPEELNVDIQAILSKINYRDKPIIALIILHLFTFFFALVSRYHRLWRVVVFVYCMFFALLSETIGLYLKSKWELIGFSRDYFDDDGVFLLIFFALPPILTCIVLLSSLIGNIGERFINQRLAQREFDRQKQKRTKNNNNNKTKNIQKTRNENEDKEGEHNEEEEEKGDNEEEQQEDHKANEVSKEKIE